MRKDKKTQIRKAKEIQIRIRKKNITWLLEKERIKFLLANPFSDFVWLMAFICFGKINVFWMAINMQKILLDNQKGKEHWQDHYIPFYHNDEFQIWEYATKEDGIVYLRSNANPKFYKTHHKKLINKVNYDESYTLYKEKIPSLNQAYMSWYQLSYLDENYIPYFRHGKNAMA